MQAEARLRVSDIRNDHMGIPIVKLISAAVSMMLLMASCDGSINRYSDFRQLPEAGWAYGDTIRFLSVGNGLSDAGRMSVAVRHNDDFLYRNLWVEVSYADSTGKIHADSVNIELADPLGRWNGKGIGSTYQCQAPVGRFTAIGDSTEIRVRHIMRLDTVRGIEQIGVTIEP